MAKIEVTQKTFSEYLRNNDKFNLLAKLLGDETTKEKLTELPDERRLWIDTKYIYAIDPPTKIIETGDEVFIIYMSGGNEQCKFCIKSEDYEYLMKTWIRE